MQVNAFAALEQGKPLVPWSYGGRGLIREMLETASRLQVRPCIETFRLAEVNAAIAKVRQNTIRYRAVLTL